MIDVDRLLAELDFAEGRTENARRCFNEAVEPWKGQASVDLGEAEHTERLTRKRVARLALEVIR